ncbi:MAG TPA: STAS domain-containing protein [Sedimentisphaerales bacterium]|nr:STAS domain-containing protein [Sedimentisphaerales bacterium]HOV77795.1 STAS domain-containing protein [Sedimentisphaerales bacterium]HQI27852.1 STAS domain-containing protein [Sedimentisphaerales bacterium]
MAIQNLSEQVLLITLPAEPQSSKELEVMVRSARAGLECDVIVDFSLVEILSSATLCNLMILERLVSANDRQLILCSVPKNIAGIFTRVGLDKLFRFAEDEFAAAQSLDQRIPLDP